MFLREKKNSFWIFIPLGSLLPLLLLFRAIMPGANVEYKNYNFLRALFHRKRLSIYSVYSLRPVIFVCHCYCSLSVLLCNKKWSVRLKAFFQLLSLSVLCVFLVLCFFSWSSLSTQWMLWLIWLILEERITLGFCIGVLSHSKKLQWVSSLGYAGSWVGWYLLAFISMGPVYCNMIQA